MVGCAAREDRRADDGVQEGADRGRRRHGSRRGAAPGQARQQGPARRFADRPPKASSLHRSKARPAPWSRSTARPTSSPRTIPSWRSQRSLATLVAERDPADVDALGSLPLSQEGFGPTVEDVRKGLIGKIGENMSNRRFQRYAGGGRVASYLHGTRIGVLVEYEGDEIAARTSPCTSPP
jgi:hypothetical protein